MKKRIVPSAVRGEIAIPGSKSHTIRALLMAAMADGESVLRQPLFSEDTRACMAVCRAFGAEVAEENGTLRVHGVGRRFEAAAGGADVMNSGTTLFFAAALAALQSRPFRLSGDASIENRSAAPLLDALRTLGAAVNCEKKEGCAPFTVCGPLRSGKVTIDCPTSQYLSALLITLPLADGNFEIETGILREKPYVDMTKKWLDDRMIACSADEEYKKIFIPGGQIYRPFDVAVPADFSSACFFLCAAAITGSRLTFTNLDMCDVQGDKEVVFLLEKMGCRLTFEGKKVTVEGNTLKGTEIDMTAIPDALPVLSVTACYAEGETRLYNAAHTRLKETDRIRCMTTELTKLGAAVTELPDGMVIRGCGRLKGGAVLSYGDHRIAMALAVAGLAAEAPVTVDGAEAAAVTFPDFYRLLAAVSENPQPGLL